MDVTPLFHVCVCEGEGMDGKWEGLKVVKGVKLRVGKKGEAFENGKR
jgi:hypothetical protein